MAHGERERPAIPRRSLPSETRPERLKRARPASAVDLLVQPEIVESVSRSKSTGKKVPQNELIEDKYGPLEQSRTVNSSAARGRP